MRLSSNKGRYLTSIIIFIFATFPIFLPYSPVSAQTFAVKDFHRVIANFRHGDRPEPNRDSVQASFQLSLDSVGGFRSVSARCDTDYSLTWLYVPDESFEEFRYSNDDMYMRSMPQRAFSIMQDACGFETGYNVLTCWEFVGKDSLQFVGLDFGEYESGIGLTRIRRLAQLPDTTVLLCIENVGADGGEGWGGSAFLREVAPCQFDKFYEESWSTETRRYVYFDLDGLYHEQYRVTRTIEFMGVDPYRKGVDSPALRPDSARANVIDLWNLAVDFFKLDTARIRR